MRAVVADGAVVERIRVGPRHVVGVVVVGDAVVGADEVVAADHLLGREAAGLDDVGVVALVGLDGALAAEVRVRVVDPGVDDGDRQALAVGAELVADLLRADERDAALVVGLDDCDRLDRGDVVALGERRGCLRGHAGAEAVDERVVAEDHVAAGRLGGVDGRLLARAGRGGARLLGRGAGGAGADRGRDRVAVDRDEVAAAAGLGADRRGGEVLGDARVRARGAGGGRLASGVGSGLRRGDPDHREQGDDDAGDHGRTAQRTEPTRHTSTLPETPFDSTPCGDSTPRPGTGPRRPRR